MGQHFGVYALYRPNGVICYIGKGKAGRPYEHFKNPAKHRNKHLGRIILNAGGTLEVRWLISHLTERDALEEEIKLIREFGRIPYGPLVNLTNGGDGVSGLRHNEQTKKRLAQLLYGRTQSATTIAKRIAKLRGRKMPPRSKERLERQAASLRGRKLTDEHKEKIGLSHNGQRRSEQARQNMSAAQRGRTVTDETRAILSAAHIGKKQSKETIEKRVAQFRGKKRDPSIGAKCSLAQKGRPKSPESVERMKATLRSPEVKAKISGENHWARKRARETRNDARQLILIPDPA